MHLTLDPVPAARPNRAVVVELLDAAYNARGLSQYMPRPRWFTLRAYDWLRSKWKFLDITGSRTAIWVTVWVAALVFALSFGLNYGVGNQNTYLIGGLRLAHPELLSNDWLATQTTEYHKFFAYPAALLFRLDSSGWSFAIANAVMILIGGLLIFLLTDKLTGLRERLPVFLVVIAMSIVTRTFSASGSYLYDRVFQPSTIGSTGLLVACYLFLRRSYLLSGLALAVGGLFHANFLILGFPVFLVAHVLISRKQLMSRLMRQYAAPFVALALLLPSIIPVLGGTSAQRDILLKIVSPFHYYPRSFWWQFLPLIAWILLWIIVTPRRHAITREMRPGVALTISLTLLIAGATLLTTVVYIPAVAQAYVWRLCPLLLLLLQICVVGAAVRPLTGKDRGPVAGRSLWVRLVIAPGVCVLAALFLYLEHSSDALWVALLLLAATSIVVLAPVERWRSLVRRSGLYLVGAFLAFALVSSIALADRIEKSSLLNSRDATVENLYSWVGTTDTPSVFLIPPDWASFRLATGRAIVVDDRSFPFVPSQMQEWYLRLMDVSGGSGESAIGYQNLSAKRLRELATKYAVDYVVLRQPVVSQPPPEWHVAYANSGFRVLRVDSE